ncbi:acyl-CoA--sterol O-acyltransferase 1-like [Punica granatum]|uniref:Wax synthase domain-containing protein n=2 Tax=Punica granatum TaxID=22663 RepID=A0A218XF38_PUNGR|nr:acyl-CoA--sterol O-acyltransferase 1-like [Punica granatum]OWM83346.1 hypothetical protein CDL15_Pgr012827 [Punica granatum]PKI66398.1 hypothetical protein CRG98_013200 [Punica granatum]
MEGELNNLLLVWISAAASLCYCHAASKLAPAGPTRLLCLLPVVCLFLVLPLRLTTISLGGLTSFFLTWLANFKLLLLAFGQGPLCSDQLPPLPRFLAIACLPIKLQAPPPESHDKATTKKGLKSPLNYAGKCVLLALLVPVYEKDWIHPKVIMLMYAVYMYIGLEVSLAIVGAVAYAFTGVLLEPQFDEPYLSTSLQDFWGRRWNLMVTSILHPSVYDPVRLISARMIGRRWASLPAAFSVFLVSGLMHELIFYHIGRRDPTWVVTCFFLLHGVSVAAEIGLKKAIRWRLPAAVSCPLTVGYITATGLWLFIPPLLECDAVPKARRESRAVIELLKGFWSLLRFSSITIASTLKN